MASSARNRWWGCPARPWVARRVALMKGREAQRSVLGVVLRVLGQQRGRSSPPNQSD